MAICFHMFAAIFEGWGLDRFLGTTDAVCAEVREDRGEGKYKSGGDGGLDSTLRKKREGLGTRAFFGDGRNGQARRFLRRSRAMASRTPLRKWMDSGAA